MNGHVSDLFFNLDHSEDKIHDEKKQFVAFDIPKLNEMAVWFSDTLEAAGGPKIEPDDLVSDFLKRV